MIGGSVFCGMYYWWMYIFMEPPIAVEGVLYQPMSLPAVTNVQMVEDVEHRAGSGSWSEPSPDQRK